MNQFYKLNNCGNILTISLQLYRWHFWQNFKLSCIAYLWLLIPLYGWAKHQEVLAMISRLAWYRLNSDLGRFKVSLNDYHKENSKTDINQFYKAVPGKGFSFLIAHFLVIFLDFLKISFISILIVLVFAMIGLINFLIRRIRTPFVLLDPLAGFPWLSFMVICLILILIAFGLFWFYTKMFMFEVIFGIEKESSMWRSITKSWQLKKRAFLKTQGLIILLLTLTAQILILFNFGLGWLFSLGIMSLNLTNETEDILLRIYFLIATLITVVFLQPVWQNAKTILYYNLRNIHQGVDLLRIQKFDEQENKFS